MASKRQYKRRPNRRLQQHRKKKAPSNKTLNKKIHHIENTLIELKFIDIYQASNTLTTNGIDDFLLPIAEGSTASQRDGNIVIPTSLQWRFIITADPDVIAATRIRCILFWDQQANGALPVLIGAANTASLLDTSVITDSTIAPRNYNTIKRYKILYDKSFQINPNTILNNNNTVPNTTTGLVPFSREMHVYKKLNRTVKFNDTTGVIGSVVTNSLFAAYFCDQATVALQPTVRAGYRVYYRDA